MALRVRLQHVRRFIHSGEVHESMRPFVSDATMTIASHVEDLGGEDRLTSGQRIWLHKLWRSMVIANWHHARMMCGGVEPAWIPSPYLRDETAALHVLGIGRTEHEVPTLAEYVQRTDGESSHGGPDYVPIDSDRP